MTAAETAGTEEIRTRYAEPLRDLWYYALPSAELKRGRMLAKTMLGETLLLARDAEGAVFVLRNICPHRGVPLTYGSFDGREVQCPYHGWRFDAAGRCTAIPALSDRQAGMHKGIRVKAYTAVESQGNVWIHFGTGGETPPPVPLLPGLPERSNGVVVKIRVACGFDHAVIGLIDPAHGPFVHRSWWWRTRRSMHEKAKSYGPSPRGFTMARHKPSSNSFAYRILGGRPETEITFRLPGIRVEHIRIGRHHVCNLTAVTPLAPGTVEITNAIYWTMPWMAPAKPLLRLFASRFLNQDRAILRQQQEGLAFDPPLLLLGDADAPARWYYRLKKEHINAGVAGRPFVNPVRDSVLRWRT